MHPGRVRVWLRAGGTVNCVGADFVGLLVLGLFNVTVSDQHLQGFKYIKAKVRNTLCQWHLLLHVALRPKHWHVLYCVTHCAALEPQR